MYLNLLEVVKVRWRALQMIKVNGIPLARLSSSCSGGKPADRPKLGVGKSQIVNLLYRSVS